MTSIIGTEPGEHLLTAGPDSGPLLDTVIFRKEPRLIGLCSFAMGSGKSVVANRLVDKHGFVQLKFAGPLKSMIRTLLEGMGLKEIDRMLEGDLKEVEIEGLGVTPRWLMQSLGTEWGRDHIRPDLWVYLAQRAAEYQMSRGWSVVFDDLRFLNEMKLIENMGGTCVRINRPSAKVATAHASEGELDHLNLPQFDNIGSIDDLVNFADVLAVWRCDDNETL